MTLSNLFQTGSQQVCEKMQDRKRDVYNIAERRGGTLNVDDDDKPKFDWKQTR